MDKLEFPFVNNGVPFDLPELTIGDIRKAQQHTLDVLRENLDLRGTSELRQVLSYENSMYLICTILKRVDTGLTDEKIYDSLTPVYMEKMSKVLRERDKEHLAESGVDVTDPREQASKDSKKVSTKQTQ